MIKPIGVIFLILAATIVGSYLIVSCNRQVYEDLCKSKNAVAVHSGQYSYICVDSNGRIVP